MRNYKYSLLGAFGLASLMIGVGVSPASGFTDSGGGHVLPASARPLGYTLTDMASKLALFNASGEDLQYYPKTPFQILFVTTSPGIVTMSCPYGGSGIKYINASSFNVSPGTHFFVPLWSVDDSPPIVGDFPESASEAANYFFSVSQVGGINFEIIVDGKATHIGPDYVAGPVLSPQPLPDGGGRHLIELGAFLTPMSVGTHTVTIKGQLVGTALGAAYPPGSVPGFPDGLSCFGEDDTYSVAVVPGAHRTALPANQGPAGRHESQ
jgi:hypothetical protein